MITCTRTDSANKDFQQLVAALDKFLSVTDGDEHAFYDQFNKIVNIKHAVVAYDNGMPVGCGAIKPYSANAVEVKRMFVNEDQRGKGIASIVLKELENWALEMKYTACILETGKRQHEAISFYQKNNYTVIPNFGQYKNVDNSVCFEKKLI